jgi:hypothetical protein
LVKSDGGSGISLKRRCELLGVARSTAYYKPKKKKDPLRKLGKEGIEKRMAEIDHIHNDMPATGARKMAKMLTSAKLDTTRYEATRLMEMMNIRCVYPKPNLSKVFMSIAKSSLRWYPAPHRAGVEIHSFAGDLARVGAGCWQPFQAERQNMRREV